MNCCTNCGIVITESPVSYHPDLGALCGFCAEIQYALDFEERWDAFVSEADEAEQEAWDAFVAREDARAAGNLPWSS